MYKIVTKTKGIKTSPIFIYAIKIKKFLINNLVKEPCLKVFQSNSK